MRLQKIDGDNYPEVCNIVFVVLINSSCEIFIGYLKLDFLHFIY
jgi:hypothetical protein